MNLEREIPGVHPVEWREYRYIADDGNDYFVPKNRQSRKQSLFEKVTSQFEIANYGYLPMNFSTHYHIKETLRDGENK